MRVMQLFHCVSAVILLLVIPQAENAATRNATASVILKIENNNTLVKPHSKNRIQNALASENVTNLILADIKGLGKMNQNWDLALLEEINKVDGLLINLLVKYLKGFIPSRFMLQKDHLAIPNLQFNLSRVSINISDVQIHNLQNIEFVRNVSKIKLGTYTGTAGYIWPRIDVSGFYVFRAELKNKTKQKQAVTGQRNFTILYTDLSLFYNWKLQVVPLRLKKCEPKLHVRSVKVDLGEFGKGPVVSSAVNNVFATYIQESINDASLFLTIPLEYWILNTFNGASWMCQKMAFFLIQLVPGGQAASSVAEAVKIASKLAHFRH